MRGRRHRRYGEDQGRRRTALRTIVIGALLLLFCTLAALAQSGATTAAVGPARNDNTNGNPDLHPPAGVAVPGPGPIAAIRTKATAEFAKLPLHFEANRGQTDPQVKFLSRGPGYTLFLTQQEAVFAFASPSRSGQANAKPHASALRLRFEDGNPNAPIAGQDELPGKTNYFLTSDRSQWHTGIPNYSRVAYENLYPGVNAVFHGSRGRLEFDFDVAPGANPSSIALDVTGGRALRLDADGNIVLGVGKHARGGEITLGKPVVYQYIPGICREIPGRFILRGAHRIGFELGSYDRAQPLVIDPSISYSTYLGSTTGQSYGSAIAVDSSGSAYILGDVSGGTFPGATGPFTIPDGSALVVSKLSPDGSTLDYTSFFPQFAAASTEIGNNAIAVDANDSAYIAADSLENMATPGAFQNPAFGLTVVKLSPDGSQMDYAAQLGPITNTNVAIAVDASGSAYVASATSSSSFSTTAGAYQPTFGCTISGCVQATVTKISADGSSLVYSTFLGGSYRDTGTGIAIDTQGDAYVAGVTSSDDFPVTSGAVQGYCLSEVTGTPAYPNCGDEDAFLTELDPTGSGLLYSTFLGNGAEISASGAPAVALDTANEMYLSGATISNVFASALSTVSGPTIFGPPEQCAAAGSLWCATTPEQTKSAFIAKFSVGGSQLMYLGFLGGYNTAPPSGTTNGATAVFSLAVDSSGRALLVGASGSSFYPVTTDAFQSSCQCIQTAPFQINGQAAIFAVIDPTQSGMNSLLYSTYLGGTNPYNGVQQDTGTGIAVDSSGNAYLTGITQDSGFPTTSGTIEQTCPTGTTGTAFCSASAFITKFITGFTSTAATITAVSGGGQSATIGSAFANPLVVKVTDASGDPVSGVTVTFIAPTSGASASLSSSTATTASDGTASVTVTANGIAGTSSYEVSAFVSGVSTPATFSLTNTQAATTIAVTPSALSLVYGQPVTINAAISPASVLTSNPTGAVAFYDDATALTPDATVASAAASYTVSVPTVGSHTYAAQYLGDTNFAESALTNATSAVVVSKASVTLTAPATQPVRIQSGTAGSIAVTIAGEYNGSGIASPTGGLTYSVSGNAFGPGSLLVANGTATIPVPSTVAAGAYTVTVSYAGDENYNSASINISLTISAPLAISPATLPAGIVGAAYAQTLSATAGSGSGYSWTVTSGTGLSAVGLTLSPSGVISGNPTGTETAAAVTVQVADSLGDLASQTYHLTIYPALTITPATLPTGFVGRAYTQTLTATGGSGSGYQWGVTSGTALSAVGLTLSSAGVISGTPTGAETAAAFSVDAVDSLGNVTTMTYHLTIYPTLSVSPATLPAGTVGTAYSQALSATGGSGTGYTFTVTAGTALSAVGLALSSGGAISGTPTAAEAAASVTIQVTDSLGNYTTMSYQLTINSAPSPITINDPETITVNDSATQVQLIDVSDPETITVTDIAQVTVEGGTSVHLSGPATAEYGQSVSITAAVNPVSGSGTPAGTVTFTESATALATITLNSSGVAVLTTNTLPVGADTITATYSGSSAFLASNSSDVVTVSKASTSTVLADNGPPSAGYSTTFTATVTPSTSGTPTGTVTFYDDAVAMGSATLIGGIATLATDTLPAGSDTITAIYSGDGNFLTSTSNTLSPLVSDFRLTVSSPTVVLVAPGQSISYRLVVSPVDGAYDYPVSFSVSGLPSSAAVTFNPATVTPNGKPVASILTITAPTMSSKTEPFPSGRGGNATLLAFLLPIAALYRRRRQLRSLLVVLFALGALGMISGCVLNQLPKTYRFTVTATSGIDQHTVTLTVIAK